MYLWTGCDEWIYCHPLLVFRVSLVQKEIVDDREVNKTLVSGHIFNEYYWDPFNLPKVKLKVKNFNFRFLGHTWTLNSGFSEVTEFLGEKKKSEHWGAS